MAHYKRRKPRTHVKCTLCTSGRFGNSLKGATKTVRKAAATKRECVIPYER